MPRAMESRNDGLHHRPGVDAGQSAAGRDGRAWEPRPASRRGAPRGSAWPAWTLGLRLLDLEPGPEQGRGAGGGSCGRGHRSFDGTRDRIQLGCRRHRPPGGLDRGLAGRLGGSLRPAGRPAWPVPWPAPWPAPSRPAWPLSSGPRSAEPMPASSLKAASPAAWRAAWPAEPLAWSDAPAAAWTTAWAAAAWAAAWSAASRVAWRGLAGAAVPARARCPLGWSRCVSRCRLRRAASEAAPCRRRCRPPGPAGPARPDHRVLAAAVGGPASRRGLARTVSHGCHIPLRSRAVSRSERRQTAPHSDASSPSIVASTRHSPIQ